MICRLPVISILLFTAGAFADGPADNDVTKVKPIPPKGIAVPADLRTELRAGCDELAKAIDGSRKSLAGKPDLLELLPDVEVYHKAVDWALKYDEFYDAKEFAAARKLLDHGRERASQLAAGNPKWTTQTGLVVRGYRSKIDGSVQPFGLVVPASWSPQSPHKFRLDLWWHGRGETLTELNFIRQRETQKGEFSPPDTIVLHPYGRYCNANKFAGEVDTFEAINAVKKHYKIDEDRIVARGFSMGGAACWQFATHFPSVWCAANPGAGFAETADFLKVFQNEKVQPTEWEKKLWHWYDATDYAGNLFNLPTIAYSGEIDKQKQAADMMAKAMKAEGLELVHLIGPGTAHKYHPETKKEVAAKVDALAAKGRPAEPERVKFTTYTLRYDRSYWLTVDRLEKHWDRADVDADLSGKASTRNVAAFHVWVPYQHHQPPKKWLIDGQEVIPQSIRGDGYWSHYFLKRDGKWAPGGPLPVDSGKSHGLQGPIDDAFLDRFLMVRPTGKPLNEKVGAWAKGEMEHAIKAWRDEFRGEAPVKDDTAVTDADIRDSNLILWGDPSSNKVLAKIADKLPIPWDQAGIRFGPRIWPGE
ncbi:MAG TPA: prolyl oligopeptidase family serine peptidase, partial [Gemmataceae bacterium]|nr:prolyl oligopeptidase family serine peptidase [Gemmataceae bacterium]